jgi:hypothetical protein
MIPAVIPASPLSLNQFTRDYWGQFDPAVIAQLAQLANDPCYTVKLYKAPADNQEVFAPFGYITYGMQITPGSLIYGFYLPAVVHTGAPTQSAPGNFTVQIRDVSLEHDFFDEPVASIFLANFKPTYQTQVPGASAFSFVYLNMGSFPNLWCAAHPVTGSGQFDIQIQNTLTDPDTGVGLSQRIELVLGVLEVCEHGD